MAMEEHKIIDQKAQRIDYVKVDILGKDKKKKKKKNYQIIVFLGGPRKDIIYQTMKNFIVRWAQASL